MQGGIPPALDTPALVVVEVQVKPVQLVRRQQVDEPQQRRLREEVPGHIEMPAAPGEGGSVVDLGARQVPWRAGHRRGAPCLVGKQLAHGLRRVERARLSPGRDAQVAGADTKLVTLCRL